MVTAALLPTAARESHVRVPLQTSALAPFPHVCPGMARHHQQSEQSGGAGFGALRAAGGKTVVAYFMELLLRWGCACVQQAPQHSGQWDLGSKVSWSCCADGGAPFRGGVRLFGWGCACVCRVLQLPNECACVARLPKAAQRGREQWDLGNHITMTSACHMLPPRLLATLPVIPPTTPILGAGACC